jgi:hypothetical protein
MKPMECAKSVCTIQIFHLLVRVIVKFNANLSYLAILRFAGPL